MTDTLIGLAEFAKKKLAAKKAQDFVVKTVVTNCNEIKFVNNEIVKTSATSDAEIEIFAVLDKRVVFTSVKETDRKKISKSIDKLAQFSKKTLEKEDFRGIADGKFKHRTIANIFDKKIQNLSAKDHVDYVEAGVDAALSQGASRASGIFDLGHNNVYLTTSSGIEAQYEKSEAYFSIRALIDKEASGHNTSAACMLRDLDASRAGAAAGEIARLSQKPGKGKGGKYDVIFSPLAFAPLVSVAGGVASIFSVESGFSFFKDKVGKKVASSSVTLHDDGTLPGGYGSKPFDDEGVPTQRNTLIDKGTYKTHLYNTSYARKYKTRSTGNAGLISPDPWHLVLEPGKLSKENLFSQVKNGIYISNVWYTRFQNYQTGDFSTIPRDGMFIIKNGEFQKPIKQLRVSDNVLRLLQNVSAAANDSRQVWSWELGESGSPVTMPHILIKNVNLTEPTA